MTISKLNILKEKRNITNIALGSIWVTILCHSICCLLPLFGVVLGLNIISAIIHKYEWVYVVINIIAILVGFYMTYFHKKRDCDHSNCSSVKLNPKLGFWIATGFSVITSICLIFLTH